jgi:hypothetical protein
VTRFHPRVVACQAPKDSAIEAHVRGADFWDAYGLKLAPYDQSALALLLQGLSATPKWVETLMAMRNAVVRRLGLKALGALSAVPTERPVDQYAIGERVGPFTLLSHTMDEVVVHDDDKHLRVILSLHRTRDPRGLSDDLVLTTAVHVHNLWGHLYMLPVKPLHQVIAPAVLARFSQGRVIA